MKRAMVFLGFFTAAGIIIYWSSVFLGIFKVEDIIPGYKNWFMSFPIADLWIATCALLSSILLLKNNDKSSLFGLLAGSSMIFLGLYALLYGINTRLLFNLTSDEIIEIIIKIYCLSVGTMSIVYFWKRLRKN
ncbi:hypothetical protein LBMAG35_16450 [Chlorobiota bacterium]|nr:hypothetical protein LBMAG35_16450 [Chlorobiota bacterium]